MGLVKTVKLEKTGLELSNMIQGDSEMDSRTRYRNTIIQLTIIYRATTYIITQ